MNLLLLFLSFRFFSYFSFFLRFCGYIFCKPLRGLTRPLGEPSGLKGLLHALNVTVIPTKVSYVCSLAFYFLFLVLLEDEQKIGVGVFVRPLFDHILAHIICFMLNLI